MEAEFARQRDPVLVEFDAVELMDEVVTVLPPPSGVTVQRLSEMAPVRRHVAIPRVWEALDGSGAPRDPQLAEQAHALLDDMAWWAAALRAAGQAAAFEEA